MSPKKPTLIRPSTAELLEAIGDHLGHDSADETIGALVEHLAAQAGTGNVDGDPSPEQLAEDLRATAAGGQSPLDEKAEKTLTLSDLRQMEREQLSPAQHLRQNYNVDPAAFTSEQALHRRVSERRNELKGQ